MSMSVKMVQEEVGSVVHRPAHYVLGRTIEPIEVIESWGLIQNHYLACAFKYVARLGRKGDPLLDLKKALWYLDRFEKKGAFLKKCVEKGAVTPEALCADWGLSRSDTKAQILQSFYDVAWGQENRVTDLKKLICQLRTSLLPKQLHAGAVL